MWEGSHDGESGSQLWRREYEGACSQLDNPGSREKGNGDTWIGFSFFSFYLGWEPSPQDGGIYIEVYPSYFFEVPSQTHPKVSHTGALGVS